ncbi:MAG: 2-dehydropantoate 2-reductase [Akkermansia sp.]
MKIAILGAGALGCYYGAKLAQSGLDVSFIMRSGYEHTRDHGLLVKSDRGDIHLNPCQVFGSPESCGPVDLVFVCWKTTVNHQLATNLPPLLHEGTKVVTLQNGMGNAEAIAQFVPKERVFIGLCYLCAMLESAGVVEQSGPNDVRISPLAPSEQSMEEAAEIAQLFQQSDIAVATVEFAEQTLWGKLSWNIPFNGLCLAHGGISIEELFAMPDQVERARLIMAEVCHCAALRGFAPPASLVTKQMERTSKMTTFIPSSALDYKNGRPVEYDAIWGIPLEKAHEVHASVPNWEQLAADIRQLLGR